MISGVSMKYHGKKQGGFLVPVLSIAALILSISACGGGDGNGAEDTAPGSVSAPLPDSDPNAQGELPPSSSDPTQPNFMTSEPATKGQAEAGKTYVYYNSTYHDPSDDSQLPECDFINPYAVRVSGSQVTFQEEGAPSSFTLTNGTFFAVLKNNSGQSYSCSFTFYDDTNVNMIVDCFNSGGSDSCENTFTADLNQIGQMPVTVFDVEASTDPDACVNGASFFKTIAVEFIGNQATVAENSASATSYVLADYRTFDFDFDSTNKPKGHAVVSNNNKTLIGTYNSGQCSFVATAKTAVPPPSNPAQTNLPGCSGFDRYWKADCWTGKYQ